MKLRRKQDLLLIGENPIYTDEQILAVIKIPKRTYFRYKSEIWKEEEEKMHQKRMMEIKQQALEFRNSLNNSEISRK